jgi:hypothetical protein
VANKREVCKVLLTQKSCRTGKVIKLSSLHHIQRLMIHS